MLFTDEFQQWWASLSDSEQDDVALSVRHLVEFGPALGFPHSSRVVTSRYPQMRELRTPRTAISYQFSKMALEQLVGHRNKSLMPPIVACLVAGNQEDRRPEWIERIECARKDVSSADT